MDIQQDARAIEQQLRAANSTIQHLCSLAGITPQSWRNWRDGRMLPQMAKWQKVLAAVEDIKTSQRVDEARHSRKRPAA